MTRAPKFLGVLLCGVSLLTAPRSASPSTTFIATFDELVTRSAEVFVGTTVERSSRFVDTPDGRAIVTIVTFRIDESLKGDLKTQTSLEFLGGAVGDVGLAVAGMPEFHVGDRDVIFVGNRRGVSPIVGLAQGRFRIMRDPERGVDQVRFFDGSPLASTAAIGRPRSSGLQFERSLTLAAFREEILSRLRAAGGGR